MRNHMMESAMYPLSAGCHPSTTCSQPRRLSSVTRRSACQKPSQGRTSRPRSLQAQSSGQSTCLETRRRRRGLAKTQSWSPLYQRCGTHTDGWCLPRKRIIRALRGFNRVRFFGTTAGSDVHARLAHPRKCDRHLLRIATAHSNCYGVYSEPIGK